MILGLTFISIITIKREGISRCFEARDLFNMDNQTGSWTGAAKSALAPAAKAALNQAAEEISQHGSGKRKRKRKHKAKHKKRVYKGKKHKKKKRKIADSFPKFNF
ncbi:MAG: hypothetical protein FD143_3412 [Ignavibacteria bacterium]|nr:MAG: hypothetical protein FD143_3412 [Ignavibacteria bacterium]